MMYRLQNKNFEKVDFSLFDCQEYMLVPEFANEEMQKRIDKQKTRLADEDLTEDKKQLIASNNAYIETLRNALAHGNIDITFKIKDNKSYSIFSFTDDWTNKDGERQIVEIRSTTNLFDCFLDTLELAADGKFKSSDEILEDEIDLEDSFC